MIIDKENHQIIYNQKAGCQHDGFHSNIQIHWKLNAKVIIFNEHLLGQPFPLF